MRENPATIVRAFDGSLRDAEGLLAVERATFDEAPYSPAQVRDMLTAGRQRAWLAQAGDLIAGFVIAFPSFGLHGPCWEIDLLAVHPRWTGRGLAARLIRAASAHGARLAAWARAAVATENEPSRRAFTRAGFHAESLPCHLLIYRTDKGELAHDAAPGVQVRPAQGMDEVAKWLAGAATDDLSHPGLSVLVAEQDGRPAGYVELFDVQTLLYSGLWIESLFAAPAPVRAALVQAALQRAAAAGLQEVGAMVPAGQDAWQETLLALGFRSLGHFYWLVAPLPLPGLASVHGSGEMRD